MLENIAPPLIFVAFRTFVRVLSQSNELLSCFNPWIITPSVRSHERETLLTVSPIITTVAYAILEPLIARELLRLAAPP